MVAVVFNDLMYRQSTDIIIEKCYELYNYMKKQPKFSLQSNSSLCFHELAHS